MNSYQAYCKHCKCERTFDERRAGTFTTDLIATIITLGAVKHAFPYYECRSCGNRRDDI